MQKCQNLIFFANYDTIGCKKKREKNPTITNVLIYTFCCCAKHEALEASVKLLIRV